MSAKAKGNTWEVTVTIEFPVDPHEVMERAPGDAEIDFAYRAMHERLRPALEAMRAALATHARNANWSITHQPDGSPMRRCWA